MRCRCVIRGPWSVGLVKGQRRLHFAGDSSRKHFGTPRHNLAALHMSTGRLWLTFMLNVLYTVQV
jgi:hypothetical protein